MSYINNNLTGINVSKFLEEPFDSREANKKLVIVGKEIKYLTPEDINQAKKEGRSVENSLKVIAEVIKNADAVKNLNWNDVDTTQFQTLSQNIEYLNSKIEKHNKKISKNIFTKIWDKIISALSHGSHSLKYELLNDPLQTLQNQHIREWENYSQTVKREENTITAFFELLPAEKRTPLLLKMDPETFRLYYKDRSFIEDYQLKDLSPEKMGKIMTEEVKQLLIKLVETGHEKTLHEVQNTKLLRYFLEFMKLNPKLSENPKLQALRTLETLEGFIPHEDILKTFIFVRENRDLMKQRGIGTVARSRKEILKIKATPNNIPYDLEYNTKTGDIVVQLGVLGAGACKVVKKCLFISSSSELRLKALSKQKKSDIADREMRFLKAAKNCKHVIQFHTIREYKSVRRRGFPMQVIMFPLYEMGGLDDHLKSPNLDQKAKLRIAIDIIHGIQELHQLGIVHCDIKPANIFLEKDENGVPHAVVGDLGIAYYAVGDPDPDFLPGTPKYKAPEIFNRSGHSHFGSDTWSFGVLLSELFKGSTPFDSVENTTQFNEIIQGMEKNPAPNKEETPIDYVIWKLLRPKKEERMNLDDAFSILNTEWNKLNTVVQ